MNPFPADQVFSVKVERCQRCRENHRIDMSQLANPADEYGWWGMCPITNQPVLMKMEDEQL